MSVAVSILDLAAVGRNETISQSFAGSVSLAQSAERTGYLRVWYAEHHNIRSIASSATAVLISHIGAHTSTIRLGAGGVMLPNHSPLVIAEQYGTLAELYPGRIDLGLGRAPGSDQATFRAMRRDHTASERFPDDVIELQGFLSDESPIPGITAIPGAGTHVPLYILGSSLFGAQLAAALGLPYGFASHFAPEHLHQAVRIYRERYRPSERHPEPYVIAGVSAIAAPSDTEAQTLLESTRRSRVKSLFSRGDEPLTDEQAEAVLRGPQAEIINNMMRYSVAGTPDVCANYLRDFATYANADELMVVHQTNTIDTRVRSVELLAEALGLSDGHMAKR